MEGEMVNDVTTVQVNIEMWKAVSQMLSRRSMTKTNVQINS
jgi:hypothetical protein